MADVEQITQYKAYLEADLITQGRIPTNHKVRLVCPVDDTTYGYEVALPLIDTKVLCATCETPLMVVHADQMFYQDDSNGE